MTTLTIGQLAKACEVNIDTIRYYERKNILAPSARTDTGYRLYSKDSISRLNFIRSAQSLGFTLQEITELLNITMSPSADCGDIQSKAQQKADEIETKISNLQSIKDALQTLADSCPGAGKPISECNILQYLNQAS